ncbi:MAG: ABC transporter permease [Coprobacillaceae bacterium]
MNVTTILWRNMKWRFHNKFTIIITILQPMLWLLLYSTVAKETMGSSGIIDYTAFILPGLMVLVSFGACSSSGIMNYLMKMDGSFYRILIAPIKRSSIVIGQILEAVLCSFLEVAIMVIVSLFLVKEIQYSLVGMLMIIGLLFLSSFFMAGLTYAISLILPNEVIYETVMNAIVLPVFFLSSALFPTIAIQGVLKIIINLNPFTHVINTIRLILLEDKIFTTEALIAFVFLICMGIVTYLWAMKRLKKETEL